MSKAIQQQKQFKILVIGDACLDVYYFGVCDRLSPEAPVPIFKREKIETRKGMCLNVAENLISLGHKVKIDKNDEIIRKIRLVDKRSGQHILRIDEEPKIKPLDIRKYKKDIVSYFDALVISDYDKGYIESGFILDLTEHARRRNIPVFVDSKKKDLSSFEGCIIKINEKENKELGKLPKRCELIVTLGSEGCKWNGKTFKTEKVDVHDVCGAGDVFLAGLVHMYLNTKGDMVSSINFANKCASLSVSKFGTCVINLDEVR